METINNFEDLYEDEESQHMMKIINNQQVKTYSENLTNQAKEERKQDIKNGFYIIGSIVLFAILIFWLIKVNSKLNKQEMNSCLENNSVAYCDQNTGWGVK